MCGAIFAETRYFIKCVRTHTRTQHTEQTLILFIINLFSAFQSSPPCQRLKRFASEICFGFRIQKKKIGKMCARVCECVSVKHSNFSFGVVNPCDLMALQCIEIKNCWAHCVVLLLWGAVRTSGRSYWFLSVRALRIANNASSPYLWQQHRHKQRAGKNGASEKL